jgi:hypothetical protein
MMKRLLALAFLLFCGAAYGQQQQILCNLATLTPCTPTWSNYGVIGEKAANGFGKTNANVSQLYSMFGVSGLLRGNGSVPNPLTAATGADVLAALGLYTVPQNGQLLIGNGTFFSLNTLTAGSNVTITNGPGTITISASGGGGGAFQANGTPLTSTSTINFENSAATNGLTLSFSNPSAGNVQLGLSGVLTPAGGGMTWPSGGAGIPCYSGSSSYCTSYSATNQVPSNFLQIYPETAAEISAGVTIVNDLYPPLNVLRYGTNTTPGTTDMTAALTAALSVCAKLVPSGATVNWGAISVTIPADSPIAITSVSIPSLCGVTGSNGVAEIVSLSGSVQAVLDTPIVSSGNTPIYDTLIRNIYVHGPGSSGAVAGLRLNNDQSAILDNVYFDNLPGPALVINSKADGTAYFYGVATSTTGSATAQGIVATNVFAFNTLLDTGGLTQRVGTFNVMGSDHTFRSVWAWNPISRTLSSSNKYAPAWNLVGVNESRFFDDRGSVSDQGWHLDSNTEFNFFSQIRADSNFAEGIDVAGSFNRFENADLDGNGSASNNTYDQLVFESTGQQNVIGSGVADNSVGNANSPRYSVTDNNATASRPNEIGPHFYMEGSSTGTANNAGGTLSFTMADGSGNNILTANSTTPSVINGDGMPMKWWETANTTATTITNFTNGVVGQRIIIQGADANTTIANSSGIKTLTGGSISVTNGGVYEFILESGSVWQQLSGTLVNSAGNVPFPNIVDSALTPGTSPICPNGTGGALTTSGCSTGAVLQTNGTNNSSQSTLNMQSGSATDGIATTVTNSSGGNVTLANTVNPANLQAALVSANAATYAPTLASGATNDWDPTGGTGIATLGFAYTTPNSAGSTVDGILAGSDKQQFILCDEAALGATNSWIILENQDSSDSTAANRLMGPGNEALGPQQCVLFTYVAGSLNRWLVGRVWDAGTPATDALASATSETPDCSFQRITETASATGTFTINAPTDCTPQAGQRLLLEIISPSGGTITYSWNAAYVASATVALPTTSNAASKEDDFIFYWSAAKSAWKIEATNQGF